MPRHFGQYPAGPGAISDELGAPVATAEEAFSDGYETGMTWDKFYPHNNYVPGGPYVCKYKARQVRQDDHLWKAYCEATQENNDEWRRGFDEARWALNQKKAHVIMPHHNEAEACNG